MIWLPKREHKITDSDPGQISSEIVQKTFMILPWGHTAVSGNDASFYKCPTVPADDYYWTYDSANKTLINKSKSLCLTLKTSSSTTIETYTCSNSKTYMKWTPLNGKLYNQKTAGTGLSNDGSTTVLRTIKTTSNNTSYSFE